MLSTLTQDWNQDQQSGIRIVTCDVIESSCSRSVSSSSNHIWKECAGPGLGCWRCGISYGWNLTTCDLPIQKSSTSVRQRSGRCWHPARPATDCEQNGGNLTQLRHRLQPWLTRCWIEMLSTANSTLTGHNIVYQRHILNSGVSRTSINIHEDASPSEQDTAYIEQDIQQFSAPSLPPPELHTVGDL